jgi:hypothetical protein
MYFPAPRPWTWRVRRRSRSEPAACPLALPEDKAAVRAGGRHRQQRRRRFLRKSRRLGQAALFSGVRGAAYSLGGAAVVWLLYWLTHR